MIICALAFRTKNCAMLRRFGSVREYRPRNLKDLYDYSSNFTFDRRSIAWYMNMLCGNTFYLRFHPTSHCRRSELSLYLIYKGIYKSFRLSGFAWVCQLSRSQPAKKGKLRGTSEIRWSTSASEESIVQSNSLGSFWRLGHLSMILPVALWFIYGDPFQWPRIPPTKHTTGQRCLTAPHLTIQDLKLGRS